MSPAPLQAPKGTRDFYPEEMRVQNHLFDGWRRACLDFAFEEYEGPTFEHLELFTEKSGPEIVTQLYNFKDKGERDIALRPEMTPTLARMINQKGSSLKLPQRWFSIPRLFRYEKAQKGRLREFFQLTWTSSAAIRWRPRWISSAPSSTCSVASGSGKGTSPSG